MKLFIEFFLLVFSFYSSQKPLWNIIFYISIRFNFVIQNFAQLNQVYGKENAETIKGNCGNLIYLLSSELSALEEISKLCGDKKIKGKG